MQRSKSAKTSQFPVLVLFSQQKQNKKKLNKTLVFFQNKKNGENHECDGSFDLAKRMVFIDFHLSFINVT